MHETLKTMGDLGIIPVVTIAEAQNALPLARALYEGGLPIIEITFRTAAAEEAVKEIASNFADIMVGAGTILNVEQAARAIEAGAQFIVSAGFSAKVVQYCLEQGVPVVPGCSSPSDIIGALELGLEVVKFFPSEALGGLKTLEAISKPFNMMKFIPTGGINPKNVNDYLALNCVWACGGSWMVKDEKNLAEVTRLTGEAVRGMLGFDLAHIGINAPDPEASLALAQKFAALFNLPVKEGNSSNFAGSMIEVTKSMGAGAKGHIAVKTKNMARAIAYLQRRGIELDLATAKGPAGGPPVSVYLKEEVAGFAIHLVQEK